MAFIYKILFASFLLTLVSGQSAVRGSTRRKSSSTATAASGRGSEEEGRTLGLLRPLLRLGLGGLTGRPLRSGLQSPLSDAAYGGYGGGYNTGYPNSYGGYSNYGQYGGSLNGVGYGGGYRPPVAYPQYGGYTSAYQQTSYQRPTYQQSAFSGLGGLSALASSANTPGAGLAATSGLGAVGGGSSNSAQQGQLAALLGQALGSSLRPLLSGANAGRYGASAPGAAATAGSNPLLGLLGLFG